MLTCNIDLVGISASACFVRSSTFHVAVVCRSVFIIGITTEAMLGELCGSVLEALGVKMKIDCRMLRDTFQFKRNKRDQKQNNMAL